MLRRPSPHPPAQRGRGPGRTQLQRLAIRAAAAGLAPVLAIAAAGCRLGDTLELVAERDPRILHAVETSAPAVALTLDDGPDAATTPRLLAVLAAHDARATFFLIGDRIPGQEAVVEAIVSAGHEIANHLSRDEPSVDLTPAEFERQLIETDARLRRFAAPRWLRPGSGWYDDWMFPILARHGYTMALGTAYPLDAALPWVWWTSRLARWQADPGDIVILHDAGKRGERTARTLERVLPDLARRGLRVVTLSELTGYATSANGNTLASGAPTSPSGDTTRR